MINIPINNNNENKNDFKPITQEYTVCVSATEKATLNENVSDAKKAEHQAREVSKGHLFYNSSVIITTIDNSKRFIINEYHNGIKSLFIIAKDIVLTEYRKQNVV